MRGYASALRTYPRIDEESFNGGDSIMQIRTNSVLHLHPARIGQGGA